MVSPLRARLALVHALRTLQASLARAGSAVNALEGQAEYGTALQGQIVTTQAGASPVNTTSPIRPHPPS